MLAPFAAHAADLPCGPVEPGVISLDGLTDEWNEVTGVEAGAGDANLSFSVKCNVDARALYLLVDVRDNYFARTKQTRPGEDHVELDLGGRTLRVYPGDAAAIKDHVAWANGKPMKGARSFSALQPRGWAVELALPLAEVPGYRKGAPMIPFAARVADCDSKASLKTERVLAVQANLAFGDADSSLEAFLHQARLPRTAIFFDRQMGAGRGASARALLAGHFMVVISSSDGYVYRELPFRDRRDLRDVRLIDLAGDGRDAIVLRYLEHGAGGAREVLTAWRPDGTQWNRIFAAEVGKQAGAARVDNKVSFVRRGRATDLLVEADKVTGFTEASFHEQPDGDMIPVKLPWGERRARYQFSGDEYRQIP